MAKPEVIFSEQKGKIYDFFVAINMLTRTDNIAELYNELNVQVPEDIIKSFSRLSHFVKKYENVTRLFFTVNEDGHSFMGSFLKDAILKAESVDDVINRFKEHEPKYIIIALISFYDSRKNISKEFYSLMLENKELLTIFIDGLDVSHEIKWHMLSLINYPQSILNKLYEFWELFKKEIDEEYLINSGLLQNYSNYIKGKLDNLGIDELMKDVEKHHELMESNFTTIYISIILYVPFSVHYIDDRRNLNIYVGHEFEKIFENKSEVKMDGTMLFKAFTDDTRCAVIELLKKGELCAGDIARTLGIPFSSLSHHLDILTASEIVMRRDESKKAYFSINNNAVDYAINLLKTLKN